MKREKQALLKRQINEPTRTTLILPEVLDKNVEAFCLQAGVNKNDGMLQLISKALTAAGYRPDKIPKIKIRY